MQDVTLHCDFERTHAESLGLGECLLVGPMIVRDPVAGDRGTGAIRAAPAVDEDRPRSVVIQERKHRGDLGIAGGRVAVPMQADVTHPCALHRALFRSLAPQIDHGLDADFGEAGKTLAMRLRSAVDVFVYLMKVGDTGNGSGLEPGNAQRRNKESSEKAAGQRGTRHKFNSNITDAGPGSAVPIWHPGDQNVTVSLGTKRAR